MLRIEINCSAEKELGKAFVNMFYLTLVAILVTYPLMGNRGENWLCLMMFYTFLAIVFAIIGIWLITHADKREARKAKNIMQTEVRKGIFHIQNAELNTSQDNR